MLSTWSKPPSAESGSTAKTTIVDAAQFTSSLLAPAFDGSAAAWKDPERERVLIFSQPYLENRLVLVGRRGADVSARTLADLAGKRVAIVEGYSYGDSIESGGPIFVRSASEEDSLARLLKGVVDYTLMDDLVVQYIVSNYPKEAGTRLQIGSTPLVTRELCLALRRTRPDAESIVTRFNAQLRGMIADGTYHRLLHVDWIRADINGDGVAEYVPRTDGAGTAEPKRAYALFTAPASPPRRRRSPASTSAATSTAIGRACRRATRSAAPRSARIRGVRPPASSSSPGELFRNHCARNSVTDPVDRRPHQRLVRVRRSDTAVRVQAPGSAHDAA